MGENGVVAEMATMGENGVVAGMATMGENGVVAEMATMSVPFFCRKREFVAANARGTSSSRCILAPRPVGQRDSFSRESDALRPFSLTLFQPSCFMFCLAQNLWLP